MSKRFMALSCVLALLGCQGCQGAPASSPAAPTSVRDTVSFEDDGKQPLDVRDDKIIETFPGGTLHDLTYASANGDRVAAYLIVPEAAGPHLAVLFGHWGNGNRTEFIPEAKIYARAGAVCLIPDYPWERPKPWRRSSVGFDDPASDRNAQAQAVVDLRRGIDLLFARPDVDRARLAYVGHSYGAQWGAILTAVDKRMKTSVLMAGMGEIGDMLLRGTDSNIVEQRESARHGLIENYVQGLRDLDAVRYIGRAAPVPVFMQFGKYDQLFDVASMQRYAAAASEPKKVLFYDTGHDLNDIQAFQDRYDWLMKYIGLPRVPIVSNSTPRCQ